MEESEREREEEMEERERERERKRWKRERERERERSSMRYGLMQSGQELLHALGSGPPAFGTAGRGWPGLPG